MGTTKNPLPYITLAALIIGFGLSSGSANAVSLQTLFGGANITVNDKLFDDWQLLSLESPSPIGLDQIDVVGLDSIPLNPGLEFDANGQLSVQDTDFISLDFSFRVSTLDNSVRIKDNSLQIGAFEFIGSGGYISIEEFIGDASGAALGDKFVEADNRFGVFDLTDLANFAPQSTILVRKNITIFGEVDGSSVALNSFYQHFSQVPVPEPTTLALMGLGLAGIGYKLRRSKKVA